MYLQNMYFLSKSSCIFDIITVDMIVYKYSYVIFTVLSPNCQKPSDCIFDSRKDAINPTKKLFV